MGKKARILTILQTNPALHKPIKELGGYYLSLLFYINHHIGTIDFDIEDVAYDMHQASLKVMVMN
nr:hypothetical protein LKV13_04460 [Borrelia sp. BU AG58]